MEALGQIGLRDGGTARLYGALADETRLRILRMLAVTDLKAGEIVARLGAPQNAVSYHLGRLRGLGLLRDRRSGCDARDVYYSLDLDRLRTMLIAAGSSVHPGIADGNAPATDADADSRGEIADPIRILFLCTHNSARSQLAEAIARRLGGTHVEVDSAGSELSELHPLTVRFLEDWGIDPRTHYSKTLDRFLGREYDYVITTCDQANESCPVFPGDPKRIHWSFPDPKRIADPEEQLRAFQTIHRELETRVRYVLALPHPRTGERIRLGAGDVPEERR